MPRGKDSYQDLPGYENMTMVDHIKAMFTPDTLQTDATTGRVINPRREKMQHMIKARQDAKKQQEG
jgi:hypothetical protein